MLLHVQVHVATWQCFNHFAPHPIPPLAIFPISFLLLLWHKLGVLLDTSGIENHELVDQ